MPAFGQRLGPRRRRVVSTPIRAAIESYRRLHNYSVTGGEKFLGTPISTSSIVRARRPESSTRRDAQNTELRRLDGVAEIHYFGHRRLRLGGSLSAPQPWICGRVRAPFRL